MCDQPAVCKFGKAEVTRIFLACTCFGKVLSLHQKSKFSFGTDAPDCSYMLHNRCEVIVHFALCSSDQEALLDLAGTCNRGGSGRPCIFPSDHCHAAFFAVLCGRSGMIRIHFHSFRKQTAHYQYHSSSARDVNLIKLTNDRLGTTCVDSNLKTRSTSVAIAWWNLDCPSRARWLTKHLGTDSAFSLASVTET